MSSPHAGSFWFFAKLMLRQRVLAGSALLMAFISAGGMGVGLVSIAPILGNILGESGVTLPELARKTAERFPLLFPGGAPEALILRLPTDRFDAVVWIVSGLAVLTLIGATANFLHAFFSLTLATRVTAGVRRSAYRRLLLMPLGVVVTGRGSDLISRILNDTAVLSRGLEVLTSKAVSQSARGIAALGAAFFINWRLAAATCAAGPVLAFIIRKLGKRIRRASAAAMSSNARLLEDASDVVRGFRVVKIFQGERAEAGRFNAHNRSMVRQTLRLRTAQAASGPLLETVAIFVLGALALVAAKAIIDGELSPTEFLVTLGSLAIAGGSLRPMGALFQDIQAADAASARIRELLEMPTEPADERKLPRLRRHERDIHFENVALVYEPGGQRALDGVTLRIPFGRTVALVGPNGCGKTSLLSLLPRLYEPTQGRVLIDGQDIARFRLGSVRRHIAAVTQETFLFRGTIGENIAYGTPGATVRAIEHAARLAHAHEFIARLPLGYDTPVGESGLALSGGQRQRIAIARALLRDPAILIMDEATSMVDSESESQIAAAIAEMVSTRTILIVAHRPSTILSAEVVVMMDRGRIVDSGTHAELADRSPAYRELTRSSMALSR